MDCVNVQHNYEGDINVTAFSSSVYQLQMRFLGALQLGGGNERNALQNRFGQSPRYLCGKGRGKNTFLILVASSGKAASINFFSSSVMLPKGKILETPVD
jgi:hypothetical protein